MSMIPLLLSPAMFYIDSRLDDERLRAEKCTALARHSDRICAIP